MAKTRKQLEIDAAVSERRATELQGQLDLALVALGRMALQKEVLEDELAAAEDALADLSDEMMQAALAGLN